jgi:hypothetical protein
MSWAVNRGKGDLMPLTTAEIYAKLGVEEGPPLPTGPRLRQKWVTTGVRRYIPRVGGG